MLLLLQHLPETTAELKAGIETLRGWLQTTHELLSSRGISTAEANGQGHCPALGDAFFMPAPELPRGSQYRATAQPESQDPPQPHLPTAHVEAQLAEANAAPGTERSLGAIDAAMRAQGFRWASSSMAIESFQCSHSTGKGTVATRSRPQQNAGPALVS